MKNKLNNLIYAFFGFMLACFVFLNPIGAAAAQLESLLNSVNITVNGTPAAKIDESYTLSNGDEVPNSILHKGTTYLPIRKLSEILGLEITYDDKTRTVGVKDANISSNSPVSMIDTKPVASPTKSQSAASPAKTTASPAKSASSPARSSSAYYYAPVRSYNTTPTTGSPTRTAAASASPTTTRTVAASSTTTRTVAASPTTTGTVAASTTTTTGTVAASTTTTTTRTVAASTTSTTGIEFIYDRDSQGEFIVGAKYNGKTYDEYNVAASLLIDEYDDVSFINQGVSYSEYRKGRTSVLLGYNVFITVNRLFFSERFEILDAPASQNNATTISDNYIHTDNMLFVDLAYLKNEIETFLQTDYSFIYEENDSGRYATGVEYKGEYYYPYWQTVHNSIQDKYNLYLHGDSIMTPGLISTIRGESFYINFPREEDSYEYEKVEILIALFDPINDKNIFTDDYVYLGGRLFINLENLENTIESYL